MLFYGDELGYTNDYSYLTDPGKNYDNRWMHRPVMHREKLNQIEIKGSPEERIFSGTKKLLKIRKKLPVLSDHSNLRWLSPQNHHVACFNRTGRGKTLYGLFNFSSKEVFLTWFVFREHGNPPVRLFDYWHEQYYEVGSDQEFLVMAPYSFYLMEGI
jgi:amylosucrase